MVTDDDHLGPTGNWQPTGDRIRVGVVLEAGGPVGHGFHAGVLTALERVTGWDARTAEIIVGTSAGAQVGALLRAGLSPDDLAARVMGQPLTARGTAIAQHYIRPPHDQPHPHHPLRLVPCAPRYVGRVVRHPRFFHLGLFVASLLPEGRVSLGAQAEGFRQLFSTGWPEQRLWIPAVCLDTGERVVFGQPEAPVTDVGSAVTASGAVPWMCAPVRVGLQRYVDGFFRGSTHVDLLVKSGLDLVVVSSPLSRFPLLRRLVRRAVRQVRAAGIPVLLVEPGRETVSAMGWNPLDETRMSTVLRSAFKTTVPLLEHTDRAKLRGRFEEAGQGESNGTR